jgi:hypothetical protein
MKFTPEQYKELEVAINATLTNFTEKQIIDFRNNVNFAKSKFVAFCWAVYHESGFDAYKFGNDIYDCHIETALKKILSKYDVVKI